MEKPGAGVKLAKGRVGSRRGGELGHGGSTSIDGLAKRVEFLQCGVPLAGEDIAGQLAPMGGDGEIGVGGEDAEVVEVVSGAAVIAASKFKKPSAVAHRVPTRMSIEIAQSGKVQRFDRA